MATQRQSTGVDGLDEVLHGGLLPGRVYLLRGCPGSGKTTLALQFLLAGARRGESTLFITLSESVAELRAEAAAHGWDLAGVHFLDVHPGSEELSADHQYSIFHPADVELAPVTRKITEAVEHLKPTRVVFDNLTEVRLLSRDLARHRRQVLAMKDYLIGHGATTLFLGESGRPELDSEVASVVQGVIALSLENVHGLDRRGVRVEKYRGSDFRHGWHAMRIVEGGLVVFPRLRAVKREWDHAPGVIPSGVAELDAMIGGGLDRGTSTMLAGNPGAGKTTLALAFVAQAAAGGERCAVYSFDETASEACFRSDAIGLPIRPLIDKGLLTIEKVNPLGLYPDELAAQIRDEVERKQTRVVMIDTLEGYQLSTASHDEFVNHMQQLVAYLKGERVTVILVHELRNMTGDLTLSRTGMSFITDTVLLIKSFEYGGQVHKAVGAIKKRLNVHAEQFRVFRVTPQGLRVGELLSQFGGIMQGEGRMNGNSQDRAGSSHGGMSRG